MVNIYTMTPKDRFGSNCYLIECDGDWAVVDPSVALDEAARLFPEIKKALKYILLTHAHFDHMLEIESWTSVCENVMIGERDAPALSDPVLNCYLGFLGINHGYNGRYCTVQDGDKIKLGASEINVIEAPGHTPGGVCYKISDTVFVGDTIFKDGGYGRCDLPGGSGADLWSSIYKLFSLNMIGKFYPGHGDPDTFENSIHYFR